MREKIPRSIKKIGRRVLNGRDRILALYWKHAIKKHPQKNAVREVKRQKQIQLRPVNIQEPKYFSEKMLWLKYFLYNDSPLVAQCYNKYEVRNYVESKGLGYILNELYGVWDSIDDVTWDELPEEYVMKVSNGYAGHVFKQKGEPFSVKSAKKTIRQTKRKYDYYYWITGDCFVGGTKQYIICERMLHSNLGYTSPEDYKFYCFNGEPKFIVFMFDRVGGSQYNALFLDMDFNDRHELEGECSAGAFTPPACMDEMIGIAKTLSSDFPFVRVDLYVENGKPIFGELTFTPSHVQSEKSEIELGEMLQLTNIEKYKELLSKKVIL